MMRKKGPGCSGGRTRLDKEKHDRRPVHPPEHNAHFTHRTALSAVPGCVVLLVHPLRGPGQRAVLDKVGDSPT